MRARNCVGTHEHVIQHEQQHTVSIMKMSPGPPPLSHYPHTTVWIQGIHMLGVDTSNQCLGTVLLKMRHHMKQHESWDTWSLGATHLLNNTQTHF